MRLISPIITLDVEIDVAAVRDKSLVLAGFAGLNEIEVRVDRKEAWRLLRLLMNVRVLWYLFRGASR